MEQTGTPQQQQDRIVGQVYWFDRRKGYGFIRVKGEEESSERDIFVHQSNITVSTENVFRFLVKDETVSFIVQDVEGGKYKHIASDVTSIDGGILKCEILKEEGQPRVPRQRRQHKEQQQQQARRERRGNQDKRTSNPPIKKIEIDGEEWVVIRKSKPSPHNDANKRRVKYNKNQRSEKSGENSNASA